MGVEFGILGAVCAGVCVLAVVVVIVLIAVAGSAGASAPFWVSLWARLVRKEPQGGTATSYSLDDFRDANEGSGTQEE